MIENQDWLIFLQSTLQEVAFLKNIDTANLILYWLQLNSVIAIGAIIIDRLTGEFLNQTHPVVLIGNWINWFEQRFYQNSVLRGLILTVLTLIIAFIFSVGVLIFSFQLPLWLQILSLMIVSSTLIAHRMLYDSVKEVAYSTQPNKTVACLVSRDCENMNNQDAYKAGMETYAENLSDGLVAPWLYLILFNLPGIALYKSINTLDSMVGYRTIQYEKFGKASAKLDDWANLLPARLTAMMILGFKNLAQIKNVFKMGKKHSSPNAGHPIAAIALFSHCQLGGPTYYFGKLQQKPYFGLTSHSNIIQQSHLLHALKIRNRIDFYLLSLCIIILWI